MERGDRENMKNPAVLEELSGLRIKTRTVAENNRGYESTVAGTKDLLRTLSEGQPEKGKGVEKQIAVFLIRAFQCDIRQLQIGMPGIAGLLCIILSGVCGRLRDRCLSGQSDAASDPANTVDVCLVRLLRIWKCFIRGAV